MERLLDVSDREPPEPLEQVLDALAHLPAGELLRVLHRREPFPLYDILRRLGYRWEAQGEEGRYQILIWRPADGHDADPDRPPAT